MGNVFKAIPERRPFSSYSAIGDSRQCPTCRGSGVIQDGGFFMLMMFYLHRKIVADDQHSTS